MSYIQQFGAGGGGTGGGIAISAAGNTSGALALISSGTGILAGGNNITLSQNGQSITISGASAVAPTGLLSYYEPYPNAQGTVKTAMGQGTLRVIPMFVQANVTATQINHAMFASVSTSSNSSYSINLSISLGIYTLNGGTALSLSTSAARNFAISITSSVSSDFWAANRVASFPINVSMSAGGNYWYAILSSSASTNANSISFSNVVAISGQGVGFTPMGTNGTTASFGLFRGGQLSVQTAALPNAIAFSDLNASNNALQGPLYINFANI